MTAPTIDPPDLAAKAYLTPADLENYLDIGRSSVWSRIADGSIPTVRIGRLVRIPRRILDAHLEAEAAASLSATSRASV